MQELPERVQLLFMHEIDDVNTMLKSGVNDCTPAMSFKDFINDIFVNEFEY